MNKLLARAVLAAAVVLGAIACREGVPTGDPKTPANSPIPDIDKKDDPSSSPPSPLTRDGGATRPSPPVPDRSETPPSVMAQR